MPDYKKYLRPEVLNRISRLELRARMIVEGFISGMHKSPYHGFSVEFAEHREYVPGDDIRHIDWRVYARADRFYIKQYEEETNLSTQLLLDCSGSMAYPEHPDDGQMTKFEYASCVAASLAYLLMHQQDAAGLMLFDHELREQVPPTANPAQLRGIIETIERTEPDRTTDVKVLFHRLAERLKRRGLLVVISDLLTDPDEIIRGLEHLRYAGHEVIVFHVLDHDELEFPFRDNTLFEGIEPPGIEVLTDPQALRRSYVSALQRFIRKVRSACVNQLIDYSLLSTRESLAAALTTFLAHRMHAIKRM